MPDNIGYARAGRPVAHGAGGEGNPTPGGFQEPAWAGPGCIHRAWAKWEGFVSGVKQSVGFMAAVPSLVTREVDAQAQVG